MPVFTAKATNLQSVGPIVDIRVGIAAPAEEAMKKAEQDIHPPIVVSAMIDTGAAMSVLKTGIAGQLGLHAIGEQVINTASSHDVLCCKFLVQIIFPATGGIPIPIIFTTSIIEAAMKGQNIQCLLGRDFLAHGILFYSGPDDTFTFSL